jgi:hypothetical protein
LGVFFPTIVGKNRAFEQVNSRAVEKA